MLLNVCAVAIRADADIFWNGSINIDDGDNDYDDDDDDDDDNDDDDKATGTR